MLQISLKKSDQLRTHLSVKIVFRSSKDFNRNLHKNSWIDNKETMISLKADKVIKEF